MKKSALVFAAAAMALAGCGITAPFPEGLVRLDVTVTMDDNTALPGALVVVQAAGGNRVLTTNDRGRAWTDAPPGTVQVTITYADRLCLHEGARVLVPGVTSKVEAECAFGAEQEQ